MAARNMPARNMAGRSKRSGQAAIEFAILYSAVILPLTFGIVYVAEMYWVWHSAIEFTREGARYATTHCWQADGQNVMTYMQTHVPVNIDVSQFRQGGSALITVEYFQLDPASGLLGPPTCDPGTCVPDTVTVSVTNYEFTRFVSFLHLQPVVMPSFPTSMPMQSAGLDPENPGTCSP
jgi:Flp pilus assembly protein TadG